jgi:hypothetical protein
MYYKKTFKQFFFVKATSTLVTGIAILLLILSGCESLNDEPETLEGTWNCTENSSIYGYQTYEVKISYLKADSSQIGINNFYNLGSGNRTVANVDIWNLTINSQVIDGFRISGSGTISGDLKRISMTYQVDDGSGTIDHVTATYEK